MGKRETAIIIKRKINKHIYLELIKNDIIDVDTIDVEKDIALRKIEKIKKAHGNHKLPTSPSSDGIWYTHAYKEGQKRKMLRGKSFDELLDKLYNYYFIKEDITLDALYAKWLKKKKKKRSNGTIKKYTQYYTNFYKGKKIMSRPIQSLKAVEITDFINDYFIGLDEKMARNSLVIIRGLCDLALLEEVTDKLLFIPKSIDYSLCTTSRAKKELATERAIPNDTRAEIIHELKECFNKKQTLQPIALLIVFNTGLRISELSVLQQKHVNFRRKTLSIRISESDDGKVIDDVKKKSQYGRRDLMVDSATLNLLRIASELSKKYGGENEFLFVNPNGKKYTKRALSSMLERVCKKLNVSYSPHDIRRTYATNLYIHTNHDLQYVKKELGHSTPSQTLEYIQNLVPDEKYTSIKEDMGKDVSF